MRSLSLGRYTLCSCAAAAMLAGCGGSQPPIATNVAPSSKGVTNSLSYNHSRTFQFTGKRQRFTVPAGVKWLTVVARGAAGAGTLGARGGRVYAVIPVTSGETLYVYAAGTASGTTGGFNGGANGGTESRCSRCYGFGGGGASDIRQDGDRLENRVVVAGGGGGYGGLNTYTFRPDGAGGKGGGSTGGSGIGGFEYPYNGSGGGTGGTQTYGGRGGSSGEGSMGNGNPGDPGSLGEGGAGGSNCYGSSCSGDEGGGGGGGGGYYGGGGGGTGGFGFSYGGGGGGGGGGSSDIEPSAKKFQVWQGWKNAKGNGEVVIRW